MGAPRILYVAHTGLVSGAEGALLDLLVAAGERIEATVAAPAGPLWDAVRECGVACIEEIQPLGASFRLDLSQTPRAAGQLVRAARALRRLISASGAQLVHANSLRAGLVAGAALARWRAPVILHAHDELPATRAGQAVGRLLGRSADILVANSAYTAASFERWFAGRERVLFNPLDVTRFDPAPISRSQARQRLGLPAGAPIVGLVAQITPWKGQDLAIRMAARLRPRFPALRLLIVGEVKFAGPEVGHDNVAYLRHLHELAGELGLDGSVEFWGQREDVELLTRALDVLVCPSWAEPFGRSVIEAMALETAVVCTGIGGPAEYIESGVDGILVEPRDLSGWTDAVGGLLADASRRAGMAQTAGARVRERFDRGRYADRMLSLYSEMLR